jgi:hypothetical protein
MTLVEECVYMLNLPNHSPSLKAGIFESFKLTAATGLDVRMLDKRKIPIKKILPHLSE